MKAVLRNTAAAILAVGFLLPAATVAGQTRQTTMAAAATADGPSGDDQAAALATIASVGQHVYTDVAQNQNGDLMVGGWAFECSTGSWGYVDLVIDGWPRTVGVLRAGRGDVVTWAIMSGTCDFWHTPYYSGVWMLAAIKDLNLQPGLHTAAIRIRNQFGVATVSPNAKAFVVK